MKYIVFLICTLSTFFAEAQNLVPNPSFEEYYTCPLGAGGLGINGGDPWIKYWYSMQWTPDYMHYCVGDPEASNYPTSNAWGYQEPYDGEGYVSIVTKSNFIDIRELIAIELIEPLVIGNTYDVSFYVSDADGGVEEDIDCVTNNVGLRFLNNPPYYWNNEADNNPLLVNNDVDINYSELLTDSTGWTLIEGSFLADDNYTHIAIGNFFDDENTLIIATGKDEGCLAMYYIDMVCVVKVGDNCEIIHNSINKYLWQEYSCPTQVNDNLDLSNLPVEEIQSISIVDMFGKLCIVETQINSSLNTQFLKTGMYILQVKLKNGLFKNYKFIKE